MKEKERYDIKNPEEKKAHNRISFLLRNAFKELDKKKELSKPLKPLS